MITIAIDAMGGDFGPTPIVEGVVDALEEKSFNAILVGKTEEIRHLIPSKYLKSITFVQADDVLTMHDLATDALKEKRHLYIRQLI